MAGLLKKIMRWDAVIPGSRADPRPMFYVEPDIVFLEYILKNKDKPVLVMINGTNSIYDGTSYFGMIDKSSNVPSCRPNFYAHTHYYVITLDTPWMGYPSTEGEAVLMLTW